MSEDAYRKFKADEFLPAAAKNAVRVKSDVALIGCADARRRINQGYDRYASSLSASYAS
jgi:hypothetical protein